METRSFNKRPKAERGVKNRNIHLMKERRVGAVQRIGCARKQAKEGEREIDWPGPLARNSPEGCVGECVGERPEENFVFNSGGGKNNVRDISKLEDEFSTLACWCKWGVHEERSVGELQKSHADVHKHVEHTKGLL